jgi:preprotein translocase subunit SecE
VAKEDKRIEHRQPNRVTRYFRETVSELRKVNWPTPLEALNLSKIVVLVIIVMGLLFLLLDNAYRWLFKLIFTIGA